MRRAVPAQARAASQPYSFPAPVRGWIESENLANNSGLGASVLENWFPGQSTVRLRGGAMRVANIGVPVQGLIPFHASGVAKLFAASQTAVYDISGLVPDTIPEPVISGLANGAWSYVQFGTAGGTFLLMVNGANSMRMFDGLTWTTIGAGSTPSVTGVETRNLSQIWIHGARIWAVERGTLRAWYLPVNSMGGAANSFDLASVFRRGGSLAFGATWSGDSGDGMDDRCVFVSDLGEVAVYDGYDPGDLSGWSLIGRYDIGRPVGTQVMQAGGDLLISTVDGLIPMSAVVTKDPSALSMSAVTRPIEPSWRRAVAQNETTAFQLLKWQREAMGIVGLPAAAGAETFVVNLQTGAWSRWTGLDVQCLAMYRDLAYFGSRNGLIYLIEGRGDDDGEAFIARYGGLPDHIGLPGALKVLHQARAIFRSQVAFSPRLSVAVDYRNNFPVAPNAATALGGGESLWDIGIWDVSIWDAGPSETDRPTRTTKWRSIGRNGIVASPQVQVLCSGDRRNDAELIAFDILHHPGGVVV